jgi:hypothetical protein
MTKFYTRIACTSTDRCGFYTQDITSNEKTVFNKTYEQLASGVELENGTYIVSCDTGLLLINLQTKECEHIDTDIYFTNITNLDGNKLLCDTEEMVYVYNTTDEQLEEKYTFDECIKTKLQNGDVLVVSENIEIWNNTMTDVKKTHGPIENDYGALLEVKQGIVFGFKETGIDTIDLETGKITPLRAKESDEGLEGFLMENGTIAVSYLSGDIEIMDNTGKTLLMIPDGVEPDGYGEIAEVESNIIACQRGNFLLFWNIVTGECVRKTNLQGGSVISFLKR